MARLVLLAWSTAISIISVNVWQHIISFSKCHSRFRNYQLYMLQVTWDTGLIPPRNLKEQPKHVAASNFMEENTTSFKQAQPLHLTTKPFPINNWALVAAHCLPERSFGEENHTSYGILHQKLFTVEDKNSTNWAVLLALEGFSEENKWNVTNQKPKAIEVDIELQPWRRLHRQRTM